MGFLSWTGHFEGTPPVILITLRLHTYVYIRNYSYGEVIAHLRNIITTFQLIVFFLELSSSSNLEDLFNIVWRIFFLVSRQSMQNCFLCFNIFFFMLYKDSVIDVWRFIVGCMSFIGKMKMFIQKRKIWCFGNWKME